MPNRQRSALASALLNAGALAVSPVTLLACGPKEAVVTQVDVRAHELPECPIAEDERDEYLLSLSALGPFRRGQGDTRTFGYDDTGAVLEFSPETRGLEAAAERAERTSHHGYTERRTEAGMDVLLWPAQDACTLAQQEPAYDYPGDGAGQALGVSPERGVLFMAGEDTTVAGGAQGALTFDVNTGLVALQPREKPMPTQRAFATVTPFADGFLVAGGENPTTGVDFDDRERWSSAHTYSLASSSFGAENIALQWDRTRHAAIALTDGSTLLAGGIAEGGPVLQLEAIYPESRVSSTIGLSALSVGRLEPTLLRLDDGRLVVGGGYQPIGSGVGTVEWFSADASLYLGSYQLPSRAHRAFVALPGGGLLTVACDGPNPVDEPCGGFEAAWITGDAEPNVVDVAIIKPEGECNAPAIPLLVPGSGGKPWLIAATGAATSPCVWRFNAWPERYNAPDSDATWPSPEAMPRFILESTFVLEPAPSGRVAPVALGPDAFVWVSQTTGGSLAGARFGVRGSLSNDEKSLVDPYPYGPLHLIPDRRVPVDPLGGQSVPHLFEQSLLLTPPSPGDDPLTVWVTDTRYEDFTLTLGVNLSDADEGAGAPALRYGETLVGASGACPWPRLPPADEETDVTLTAVRRGAIVTLRGAESVECTIGTGSLALGLRAPGNTGCSPSEEACSSRVESLIIQRD